MEEFIENKNYIQYSMTANMVILLFLMLSIYGFNLNSKAAAFLLMIPVALCAISIRGISLIRFNFTKSLLTVILFSIFNLTLYFIILTKS